MHSIQAIGDYLTESALIFSLHILSMLLLNLSSFVCVNLWSLSHDHKMFALVLFLLPPVLLLHDC